MQGGTLLYTNLIKSSTILKPRPTRSLNLCCAYTWYQFMMISLVDDVAKLCKPNLFTSQQYPWDGVSSKLWWSKNVKEERDAPTQFLLGAEDPDFCALNVMGAWLEIKFYLQPEHTEFYFGLKGYSNPNSIKSCYSDAVRLN